MFVEHVCPPELKYHCDVDLWPRNPKFNKFNRGHLLIMTNHHTKLKDHWAMSSLVKTRFVYGATDRPTDEPTREKHYTPLLRRGYNNISRRTRLIWYLRKRKSVTVVFFVILYFNIFILPIFTPCNITYLSIFVINGNLLNYVAVTVTAQIVQ